MFQYVFINTKTPKKINNLVLDIYITNVLMHIVAFSLAYYNEIKVLKF
jgi:hypothetical protein